MNCCQLTEVQIHMLKWHIINDNFIGVGRAVGRSVYFPAVRRGKGPLSVIDGAGYEQFAANMSVRACPDVFN